MLAIDVISVQPKMFSGFLTESMVARAVKKGACDLGIVDLREFGRGRWKTKSASPMKVRSSSATSSKRGLSLTSMS